MFRVPALIAALVFALPLPVGAQPAPAGPPAAQVTGRRLPPDVTSEQSVDLPGRRLTFTATAGALPLADPTGAVQAEIGYVAYTLAGTTAGSRPVTFAVNGGPGAASAYLHLLVAGPWRLPLDGPSISPSAPPLLVPNAETWLDFTDLVFLDPVETGYSRAIGNEGEIRDRYFSVDGDVSSIAAAISRWLRSNDRLASPKFYLGESYGGFRGPLVAQKLQTELGIGPSGLILVSPVLDFAQLGQPRHDPMGFVAGLPSLAAARLETRGAVTREALRDVEAYASGDYLADLVRGVQDRAAIDRLSARVAELTGLDPALVRRRAGRIDAGTYQREARRDEGRVASAYDTAVTTFDPDPGSPRSEAPDAILTAMSGPLSTAMVDLLWRRLGWRVPNQRYELLNGSVAGNWRYGRGRRPPQAMDEIRGALALDQNLRILVAHGLTDLVTPYFASELLLRQVPAYGVEKRLSLATFPGGHMFYIRDASRAAFRGEAAELYRKALEARSRD